MSTLNFDNRFVAQLPGDLDTAVRPRQVHGAAWSKVAPTPVSSPRLLAATPELAAAIGFDRSDMDGTEFAEEFAEVFAGNRLLAGMQTYAACYGGHQFGHWAGQLGDGRAIGLGEVIGRDGARYELQLKGSGPTPYSRHADGRAVLRSSLREFLCSEAMLHLGIPTTRALSLVSTGERVVRDMFYDGNPQAEPGAIVCRVAPSFIRFGTFELPAARGDHALLQQLVDFTIDRDFPHIQGSPEQQRGEWFVEVCERTATLMAHWMRVGFVHGVMNTDNLSILGLTIDYGPYGWIDAFDPNWTPNTTDAQGRRYAYGRQPEIAHWNLARLAEALAPLFPDPAALHAGLKRYAECFSREHAAMTAAKLGLDNWSDSDFDLARDLYALMEAAEIDMTICFRALALMDPDTPSLSALEAAFYNPARAAAHASELTAWLQRYGARLREDAQPAPRRRALMDAVNPVYLPRNYLAQQAIDAATAGELGPLHELQQVLRDPYREQAGMQRYAARRPEWARQRAGCSMLSCSS